MNYQILLLTTSVLHIQCNIPQNSSDVYITYGGHADSYADRLPSSTVNPKPIDNPEPVTESLAPIVTTTEAFADNDDVVFIPNDRQMVRNDDDDFLEDRVRVDDVMSGRRVGEYVRSGERAGTHGTTESANDIFFISGKNNENYDNGQIESHIEGKKETMNVKRRKTVLDCKHLDCNRTQNSVCGAKNEHKQWKYRLFLNECFYRKVNCAFTHEINRYEQVDINKCNHLGAHLSQRQFSYHSVTLPAEEDIVRKSRRGFASRRSLSMGMNGQMCSHTCPISCPENYDPVCAISGSGQARVFANHCKLDENSCFYGVVWHTRSLPECVGGRKADLNQNRHFISWMQKVGIVDNKGRLNLNK